MSADLASVPVDAVMTKNPRTIAPDDLLAKALAIQETSKITALIVKDGKRPIGLVHYLDLLRAGVT
jgi:arabinose-5-phosphate isomerase